ncbi:MAG: hypothetical protein HKM24_00445, partial [Gammaproteobacteria bacterium]|nr:hypothetical protein [Gammaproteobacteria bacterium]
MARSSQVAKGPMIWGNPVGRAWRESMLWVVAALAFVVLAALLSYSPDDPSFTDTGEV